MLTATLRAADRLLHVEFGDGEALDFPFLWLRDNCPSGFHPQTAEREFDLTQAPRAPRVSDARVEGDALVLDWAEDGHVSRFPEAWLRAVAPGRRRLDPAAVPPTLWHGPLGDALPRADAAALLTSDAALLDWAVATKRCGVSIVQGLADDAEAGLDVARRLGFLRETNFGRHFDVESKPDPNNLAYTSHRLPPHTDLPNQEMPPGWQFLHCLANEAQGGGSEFLDGFAAAEALRGEDAEAFRLLSETTIPFRFHDAGFDIRKRAPVIELDEAGALVEIRFNAHIADVLDLPPASVEPWYRAYRRLMEITRDPARLTTLRLGAGDMAAFDNRRILHGREAFDPTTGYRRLRGGYVDRGEVDSRIRVLSRG
ncbi:MAG: TauD/TfdA family dioxygenase [Pseudomonadota bacterium]